MRYRGFGGSSNAFRFVIQRDIALAEKIRFAAVRFPRLCSQYPMAYRAASRCRCERCVCNHACSSATDCVYGSAPILRKMSLSSRQGASLQAIGAMRTDVSVRFGPWDGVATGLESMSPASTSARDALESPPTGTPTCEEDRAPPCSRRCGVRCATRELVRLRERLERLFLLGL